MNIVRRIVFGAAILFASISCLNKSSHTTSGPLLATFEFSDGIYTTYFGPDSLYFDKDTKIGIGWDCMAFYHKITEDEQFEGGFLCSYLAKPKAGAEGLPNNEYRVNCEGPSSGRNTYTVFVQNPDPAKMPEKDIEFMLKSNGTFEVYACHINNTVAAADSVAKNFQLGDKFTLKAQGWKDGTPTESVQVVLAEKTHDKDSIMNNWVQVDLSKLGMVDRIDFELSAPEGRNIPRTVCLDNLYGKVSLSY